MSIFRRRSLMLSLLFLILATIVPDVLLACETCRFSPNGWGFCRTLYPTEYGYDVCKTVVVDSFNGRTGCEVGGFCDPSNPLNPFDELAGDDGDCWWTDLNGNCILAF